MTVRELQAKFPSIPWREYISKILPAKISIDEDEPVIVEVPSYITSLEKILEQTPKRYEIIFISLNDLKLNIFHFIMRIFFAHEGLWQITCFGELLAV